MKLKYARSGSAADSNDELRAIRNSAEQEIAHIYARYRAEFTRYAAARFSMGREQAEEVFQDSFIDLFHNIRLGRLTVLTSGLRNYLFQIANHKIFNERRKRAASTIDSGFFNDAEPVHSDGWLRKQEIADQAVAAMGEPCHTILNLYYWERRSMSRIAEIMGYKSEQVAKNRKSLCLKKLKELLAERFRAQGLA